MPNLQASLAKEKSGRAHTVASLRETISGLKAAGDVEGRLKAQATALHGQFAAAQHTQVAARSLPFQAGVGSPRLEKVI